MRLLSIFLLLFISGTSFGAVATPQGIDPDLIDREMTRVMYMINPNDIKIVAYKGGHPSAFTIKLCKKCQTKSYSLEKEAELLLNDQPLALKDLTITLIKKKFDGIQLGIDRSNNTVTYLYLGGISESSAEELAQEQSDEN
ncbi:MAG: hypothetical protein V7765_18975 [Oleispira sp.]